MATLTEIQTYTRDFQRFTGDGLPDEPVGAPLPVGDPASGIYHPSKAEIRRMLILVLQAIGDPDALDQILDQLFGKADLQNSTSSFTDRAKAVARGQENLPVNIGMILTREGDHLAIRGALASADDPLFDTSPFWGVIIRVPGSALLDQKSDLQNSTASFTSRANAVARGQENLPVNIGMILTREGDFVAVRSAQATVDDPLFETSPYWGVLLRLPASGIVDAVSADLDAEVQARIEVTGTQARTLEDGRFARSGHDYAEIGEDRRMILHHEDGMRVYDMPLKAAGEFSGTINGASALPDPERWTRSGATAAFVGANRQELQDTHYLQLVEDPARWDRCGYLAAVVGRDRRLITDLLADPASEPETPGPATAEVLAWEENGDIWAEIVPEGRPVMVSEGPDNRTPRIAGSRVVWQSDRAGSGPLEPRAIGGLYYADPTAPGEFAAVSLPWLACFGDSTTANNWPSRLAELGWNVPFVNFGRSGNTARGIASRYWALEVSYDCPEIPGDGAEVAVSPSATSQGDPVENFGNSSATGRGFLVASPSADPSTGTFVALRWDKDAGSYYLRRVSPGTALPAGKWYYYAAPTAGNEPAETADMAWRFQEALLVLLIGRNSARDPQLVFDMAKAIVAAHKPISQRFVVMPWIHATDEGIGTEGYLFRRQALELFRAEWPDNTLDIVPYLQAAAGTSPEDLDAIERDVPPPSLMADQVHPNAAGQLEQARGVMEFCTEKGWV